RGVATRFVDAQEQVVNQRHVDIVKQQFAGNRRQRGVARPVGNSARQDRVPMFKWFAVRWRLRSDELVYPLRPPGKLRGISDGPCISTPGRMHGRRSQNVTALAACIYP